MDFSLRPQRDGEGRVVYLISEGREITERKRNEQALAFSETMLSDCIQFAPAGIAMLDLEARYMKVSERYLADFRLVGKEVLGRSVFELFPHISDRWREIIRQGMEGRAQACQEEKVVRPNGTMDWIQWEVRPWYDRDGEIGGIIILTQVITQRKLAEERVLESEEMFRNAFVHSAIGMALVSLEGKFTQVNGMLCKILGRPEAELLACSFQEITHPDDLVPDLQAVNELLAGKTDHYWMKKRYLHKAGHIVWAELAVTLVRDGEGRPKHFISQVHALEGRQSVPESSVPTLLARDFGRFVEQAN